MMIEALALKGGEKVLEIGTGSGYAAAVLVAIARTSIRSSGSGSSPKNPPARSPRGLRQVRVLHGDGTLGWPDHAPYDAIVVAAGGSQVPASLKIQLKVGGRLVIPVGADRRLQELVRVVRVSEHGIVERRNSPTCDSFPWWGPKDGLRKGPSAPQNRRTELRQRGRF